MARSSVVLDPVREEIRRLDERKAAESGPVRSGWDPGAFRWLETTSGQLGAHGRLVAVTIVNRYKLTLLAGAGSRLRQAAGHEPPIAVKLGMATKAFAVQLSEEKAVGRTIWATKTGTSPALAISCSQFIADLLEAGWPRGVRLAAQWDEEHKMLVVRKPEAGKRENAYQ